MATDHEGTKETQRSQRRPLDESVERAARLVLGAAIEVHRMLGPGYDELVYERALEYEFELRGICYERQAYFNVRYKGRAVGKGRLDFLVEGCLIVELKAVEELGEVHLQQVLAYLQATGHRLGLLINFNAPILKAGVRRVIL